MSDVNIAVSVCSENIAIENGDVETAEANEAAYNKYQDEIKELKKEPEQTNQSNITPETQNFVSRNSDWFNQNNAENAAMSRYAIEKETELRRNQPYIAEAELYRQIEDSVKNFYPTRFNRQPERIVPTAPPVESKRTSKQAIKKFAFNNLSDEARAVAAEFADMGYMTRDEYAQELYSTGIVDEHGNLNKMYK